MSSGAETTGRRRARRGCCRRRICRGVSSWGRGTWRTALTSPRSSARPAPACCSREHWRLQFKQSLVSCPSRYLRRPFPCPSLSRSPQHWNFYAFYIFPQRSEPFLLVFHNLNWCQTIISQLLTPSRQTSNPRDKCQCHFVRFLWFCVFF